MRKFGKKHKNALGSLDRDFSYSVQEGLGKVKDLAYARFDETVSASVILGINPDKGEHAVRGSVVFPHSYKDSVRVIAFAKGDQAEKAKSAGADVVGAEDLVSKVLGGWLDFDVSVSTPDMMASVGKVAKILGPKGMLPNKKNGTVALDLESIIKELKSGLSFFKNDKSGQINFPFGKVSLSVDNLEDNFNVFLKSLRASRPQSLKGQFIKKVVLSSTMGPGISINLDGFNN